MNAELMIGCSDQIPDEVHVYNLVGRSSDGTAMLTRDGRVYTAGPGQVSEYHLLLDSMLGLVLPHFGLAARERARAALTRRWNGYWGVATEDVLEQAELTDDERVDQAGMGSFPASDPPPWPSGMERSSRPDADDPDGGQSRERARRLRHID